MVRCQILKNFGVPVEGKSAGTIVEYKPGPDGAPRFGTFTEVEARAFEMVGYVSRERDGEDQAEGATTEEEPQS